MIHKIKLMLTSKKFMIFLLAIGFFFIGSIIILLINKSPETKNFDVEDYNTYISEFPSDRILGPVDNAEKAKTCAESIWIELYGSEVRDERPYAVSYDATNKVWLVQGTLKQPLFGHMVGGVANILIQETDGKVLAVWHDK